MSDNRPPLSPTLMHAVRALLSDFYTPEEVEIWLAAPQPLLGGATPLALFADARGEEVFRLIHQLREGAYL